METGEVETQEQGHKNVLEQQGPKCQNFLATS